MNRLPVTAFLSVAMVLAGLPAGLRAQSRPVWPGWLQPLKSHQNLLPASAAVPAVSQTAPTSVLPQFAFGGGWYSALYFTNLTDAAVSFPVNFVSDAGTPLVVPSLGGSTAQVNLAAYGTTIIEAPNNGSLEEGCAEFTLPSGVYGYGVFRQSVAGRPDQEAVVPLSDTSATTQKVIWDETNFVTAVAIANPSSVANTVAVAAWDENGNFIGTSSIPLAAGAKTAATLRTLPGLSGVVGHRGFAQFSVQTGSVAVLGLRFDGSSFTSIPATTGISLSTGESILPQIAFGGGWYSALYFTNLTGSPVSFAVNFVSDSGSPLTVPSLGASTTQLNLAAHGTAIIEALNTGSLSEGYAAFNLPSGVYGYGVFRQTVAGIPDQEAVVPLSDATAQSSLLTWDETNFVTAVAIDNPSSTANTVSVTAWDENGNTLGTSSIPLAAGTKTAAVLKTLPGLSGIAGHRGSARFTVLSGSVDVLGLRFDGASFTSIPTGSLGGALAERALAQTGLAIGMASTVLQSQFQMLMAAIGGDPCTPLDGGGSVAAGSQGGTTGAPTFPLGVYYDSNCTKPYITTTATVTASAPATGDQINVSETANYTGPGGAALGALTINEHLGESQDQTKEFLWGLGIFVPASGAKTPVQLGLACQLVASGALPCSGAIAQDFPALGVAIGAVVPLSVNASLANPASPVTFSGGGSAVMGPLGSLTLTNPAPASLVIQGGTTLNTMTATGGAANFSLFPPTPTGWTLADSAHDLEIQVNVTDNTSRTLSLSITKISTGAVVSTGTLDQSGSGSINYSDGSSATITNWTLAD